jgi:hypothetical protein
LSTVVGGLTEVRLALGRVDYAAEDELRDANRRIAESLAVRIRSAATAEGAQAEALAPTVKVSAAATPAVYAGGMTLLGRNEKPAYKLVFGSEFGARQTGPGSMRQYKPHRGRHSYWFYKTVESNEDVMRREWLRAVDVVLRKYQEGR